MSTWLEGNGSHSLYPCPEYVGGGREGGGGGGGEKGNGGDLE